MATYSHFALAICILSLATFACGADHQHLAGRIVSENLESLGQLLTVPLIRVDQSLSPEVATGSRKRYFQAGVKDIVGAAYLAELAIGTGTQNQSVQVLLDTGSYELWVNPNCPKSNAPTFCQSFGSYDPSLSSTALNLRSNTEIQYGLGSVDLTYYQDDISISGGRVKNQQFGVATDSDRVWFGIMGLGYGKKQPDSSGVLDYNSVIDNLLSQKYINSRLFGLELGHQGRPKVAVTGQIVFGGLDTNKYAGILSKVPLDKSDPHYRVILSAITHRSPTTFSSTTILSTNLSVIIDSGTTISLLPQYLVERIASNFPGASYDGDGGYDVPCCYMNLPGSLDFRFGNVEITVPYSEFVWNSGFYDGQEHCHLGAQWNTQPVADPNEVYVILGDSFLRAAYSVFDQDNNALYMSNYIKCDSESSLVAVPAGIDAAANIKGNCEPLQPSTTSDLGTCTTIPTSYTSTPTGAYISGDVNPVGPLSFSTTSSVPSAEPRITDSVDGGASNPTTTTSLNGAASISPIGTSTVPSPIVTITNIAEGPIILGVLADGGAARNQSEKRSASSGAVLELERRQMDNGFIGGAGPANPSMCSDASGFNLSDGQLLSGGQTVSTDPGRSSMPLRVSPSGSINTTFAVVEGVLHWFNDAFSGGEAGFCQTSDGQVHITFSETGVPDDCTPVSLTAYAERECQDGELLLSAGPTAPTTAADSGDGGGLTTVSPPSHVTNTITSTVTRYIIYTITGCPATVQNCPVGQITTSTQVTVTTICVEDGISSPTPTSSDAASDGGNAVAVAVTVTVTEVCQTSTFALTTCSPSDTDCVPGKMTTATYTWTETTTFVEVAAPTESGEPNAPAGNGVQMSLEPTTPSLSSPSWFSDGEQTHNAEPTEPSRELSAPAGNGVQMSAVPTATYGNTPVTPGNGTQMGAGYNNSADACLGCVVLTAQQEQPTSLMRLVEVSAGTGLRAEPVLLLVSALMGFLGLLLLI